MGVQPNVKSNDPISLRADAVMTSSYVASSSIDLGSYDSVTILVKVGTLESGKICSTKFQWSIDNTTFADEPSLTNGTVSAGEQPQTPSSRRVDVLLTAANHYVERFHRLARYLRVAVKTDGTTGTVSILAMPSINGN